MNEKGCSGDEAMGLRKLSAEALQKREERARKREQEVGSGSSSSSAGQGNQRCPKDKTSKEVGVEEDMWTNFYDFSSFSLKVREEFGGEACVGGTQWPGGARVARYLDNPIVFPAGALKGKTLLDLGSGCGLVAAVAAKHGACVLAAEKDIVIPLLKENLASNNVLLEEEMEHSNNLSSSLSVPNTTTFQEGKVAVQEFYWGADAHHPQAPFDIVVAAACLYMPKTVLLLLHTLWNVSDDNSLVILCSILGANTLEAFVREVGSFFEITALNDTDGCVIGTSEEGNLASIDVATRVLVLRRKAQRGVGLGL